MKYVISVGFFALMCIPTSSGQRLTLGDLHKSCTSSESEDKVTCSFYILGVFEGAQLTGASVEDKSGHLQELREKRYCVPDGLSSAAIELAVKMMMGSDLAVFPQDRTMPAVSFVTAVMAKDFPCTKY
jgi:hypothetical protein